MNFPEATNRSAFLAGLWSGVAASVYFLFVAPRFDGTEQENAAFLKAGAVVLIPAFPFVFGRKPDAVGSFWERLRSDAANFVVVIKRMLFWLLGASAVSFPLSLGFQYIASAA